MHSRNQRISIVNVNKEESAIQDASAALEAARSAIKRHAWREAFDLFTAADASAPLSPERLEELGDAAWWTGRLAACITARERAYAAYIEAGNHRRAAMIAIALAKDFFAKREASVATAWLSRAERLLQNEPDNVEHGYLLRTRGVVAFEGQRDFDGALVYAQQALDLGTRYGERDLMGMALHDQGRVLVAKGRVSEGTALMDEATVAAVSGELGPMATAVIYCNTITSCKEVADYRRASEWSEAARRWCDRQAITGFPGMCRVYRAAILRVCGAWPEAEQEARRACEELREFNLGYAAESFYEIGEIRLRMGDLPAAEGAFRQAHELGREPEPGLSLLRLAEGKVKAAATSIKRALAHESSDRLHRANLLPAQVEIAIAAGDLEVARAATEESEDIARAYGSTALDARAVSARGALQLAEGDTAATARSLRRAWKLWHEIDCPYEAARARMVLAAAYRAEGDEEASALELQAARAAFDRLGAALDSRRAGELLGEAAAGRQGVVAGRRVLRTFMFTDIVKSTSLVEAIGDEAWEDLLRWHDETLRSLFARHGGEEIDHTGDGFFVAYNDTPSALECAVAIQRTLADHRRTQGFAPQVRIGLHAATATRKGSGYTGKGVHQAARIGALAEGEQILASLETLAEGAARFLKSEPRTVSLKGLSEPVQIAAIDWR
ncbi:MAG: adenylate/guanylate cyclase domain-containing protein [Armatimonadota bacterium]